MCSVSQLEDAVVGWGSAQTRYWEKSAKQRFGRLSATKEPYGVVQETQGTGRSVKYVVHFSEVAVSKAFSSRSLAHQTTDEANSSSDVPVPPSISVEAASPTLTLLAEQHAGTLGRRQHSQC